ncbi:MAG: galactokinase [Blastocatellia bacterium]
MDYPAELSQKFQIAFGDQPRVFRAPGRVNLIGEHTDYNDGFVMPAAIDLSTYVAIAPRDDRLLTILSEGFDEVTELNLDRYAPHGTGHWSDYVRGVAVELMQAGFKLRGANLLIASNLPVGAGLSSSAAVEVATALALLSIIDATMDGVPLAKLCQRAENEYVGARVGIMDQFISANGRANHALMLDCRSLDFRLLPLPESVRLVIANTMVKHSIASGEYNARRAECETAARLLARRIAKVRALRDVTPADVERYRDDLPETVYKRARHVVSENERVLRAAEALASGDLAAFGQLMRQSHLSLRDDYEVSCEELDVMVEIAAKLPGCYGARMTGGGFGGCTVNLVDATAVAAFSEALAKGYEQATNRPPQIYICAVADGAQEVQSDAATR